MAYNIDEENSDISFEVTDEKVALKLKSTSGDDSGSTGPYLITVGDLTDPSDKNVYSALRALKEISDRSLSKKADDTAAGRITFLLGFISKYLSVFEKGAQFGSDFVSGLAGMGGKIDDLGNAELKSLVLREFLEVPELRYNRVTIQVGNNWRAPGGGIIQSVETDKDADGNDLMTGTVTLKLEDGEIGKIDVDDICMGIFHDGISPSENDAEDYDDSLGNFKFSGFYTTYFRITEITETGKNSIFKYSLRATDSSWTQTHHPCAAMHFVGYGNFSIASRQNSRYSALTYERYLAGVNTWNFQKSNIRAQFGDLSNLSLFGLDMSGYSAYINSLYMSGAIEQFEQIAPHMEFDTGGDGFIGEGETKSIACKIINAYGKDITDTVTSWTITRDSGHSADDTSWNLAHTSFTGTIALTLDDLGQNSDTDISTLFTITAEGDSTVTGTLEI